MARDHSNRHGWENKRVKRSSSLKSGKADMLIISNQEQYGIWPQTDKLDLYALFDFPL